MTRFRDGTTPLLKQARQHRANIDTAIDLHTEKITRDCAGHCEGHTKTV